MFSLIEIKHKVEQLANLINAPGDKRPGYGTSENIGTPYIEVDDSNYYFLAFDRDIRTLNRKTQDIDELLYWVFAYITSGMSSSYASLHRDPKNNYRRVMFSHQLELLERLNPLWKEQRGKEIDEILKTNPYSN